jgi:hypothetical protein
MGDGDNLAERLSPGRHAAEREHEALTADRRHDVEEAHLHRLEL